MSTYPWRLRLYHEGGSSIRLERPGPWLRFDPDGVEDIDHLHLLHAATNTSIRGLKQAIEAGQHPTVVASSECMDRFPVLTEASGHSPPVDFDGLEIRSLSYTPRVAEDAEGLLKKLGRAVRYPDQAARRMLEGQREAEGSPSIFDIRLPDGGRLLHLHLSLHDQTPADWLERVSTEFRGADWILVGVPYGQDEAVARHLPGFEGKLLLLTDLINEQRASAGLPTNVLTPTVDRLKNDGLSAFPFSAGSSYRFE
jgi:hypothetical protein